MPTQPSPMPSSAWAMRHQRAAARVAEQHHGLGAAALHLVVHRLHVDDAALVQAVGVVAHVAGAEAEHGVAGGGQQRAGVVHAEVATRVRQDDRRLPRLAAGRRPQQPAHERAVGRHEADRLAAGSPRPGRPRAAASSCRPNGRRPPRCTSRSCMRPTLGEQAARCPTGTAGGAALAWPDHRDGGTSSRAEDPATSPATSAPADQRLPARACDAAVDRVRAVDWPRFGRPVDARPLLACTRPPPSPAVRHRGLGRHLRHPRRAAPPQLRHVELRHGDLRPGLLAGVPVRARRS